MAARKKGAPRKTPRPQDESDESAGPPADDSTPTDAAAVFAALGQIAPGDADAGPDKGGRPPLPLDLKRLADLCSWHCTDEEIAADLGVSVRTLERRRQSDETVRSIFDTAKARGRRSLKRELWGLALRANSEEPPRGAVSALIFLCKQPQHRGGLGMGGSLAGDAPGFGELDLEVAREELLERLERYAPAPTRPRSSGGGRGKGKRAVA